jgi:MFS family permease
MDATAGEPPPSTERSALLDESSASRPSHRDAHLDDQTDDDVANVLVTPLRGLAIGLSLGLLIFLQGVNYYSAIEKRQWLTNRYAATNMSGMTMIQGQIAEELDAHAQATWFTTAYLIPLSSLAPVAGRLATIFSPRSLVLPIALFFSIGSLLTSRATTFGTLAAGRAVAGLGGAGVLSLCIIFTLELTSKKRRGLFIGLVNSGFTTGVATGAVVYGALLPVLGWVRILLMPTVQS